MSSSLRIPKGWIVASDDPEKYELGVDPAVDYANQRSVTAKAGPDPSEFGGLAQNVKAEAYRGKRLRFSAALRTAGVENRAVLFMRINGPGDRVLAFDNMRDRFVSGSTDWTNHAIVLDVAEEAENITFGFFLSWHGQAWMANVQLETVGQDVPTTDIWADISLYFPTNLAFED